MNKTIIVSGGTKGIGKAIVEKFAQEGFDVFTCSRNKAELKAFKEHIETLYRVKCEVMQVDMSQKDDVHDFAEFILSKTKSVDVLVNNAGFFVPGQIHSEENGKLELMIETNLYSAYNLTRAIINPVIESKGHIFNICSTASITPYINGGSYCISKFALYGMSKVLREEMKSKGVRVTAVLPGATLTASWDGVELPEERFMKPEDVADSIFGAYSLSNRTVLEELIIRPQLGDI